MAKFEVKNSEGKKVAEAELAAEVYGIEPNIHVMHHIVKCQMASWRPVSYTHLTLPTNSLV